MEKEITIAYTNDAKTFKSGMITTSKTLVDMCNELEQNYTDNTTLAGLFNLSKNVTSYNDIETLSNNFITGFLFVCDCSTNYTWFICLPNHSMITLQAFKDAYC